MIIINVLVDVLTLFLGRHQDLGGFLNFIHLTNRYIYIEYGSQCIM